MKKKEIGRLTLSFVPYSDIAKMESNKRIQRLLDTVLSGKIVILQGKLESIEESGLIQATMALVGRVKGFKGVELAVINPAQDSGVIDKVKLGIARALVGNRDALTIIGPASVVKEVRRDPRKIELLLNK